MAPGFGTRWERPIAAMKRRTICGLPSAADGWGIRGGGIDRHRILWGQILVVFTIVIHVTLWTATQWTAWRLGYQPPLGPPWFATPAPGVLAASILLVVVQFRRLCTLDVC